MELLIESASCSEDKLTATLTDGRSISVPLGISTRLVNATPEQRANCQPCAGGRGLHWAEIDEDLSLGHILRAHNQ